MIRTFDSNATPAGAHTSVRVMCIGDANVVGAVTGCVAAVGSGALVTRER
jgi:hypothetical protein